MNLRPCIRLLCSVVAAAFVLAGCDQQQPSFRSTDVTGAQFGRDFELLGHDGQLRRLADFRGKVVIMFFGFTHCPDACPITLAELAAALGKLGEDAKRVQVLLVTVDPERDTPDVLGGYVTAFDKSFIGLTGSAEQIAAVAREFKVIYQRVDGSRPDSYSMDHSAGTFVFDTEGRLRLYVSYGRGSEVFAHDIAQLLKSSG
ncbi:MAG TPA: SCO family protein [Burkholderiales bacterium]|nr:SCO family protein [Burkholderiales bacterium]